MINKHDFKVLIIDDEPGMLENISKALSLKDYYVDTVDNGFAAIEKLQTGEYKLAFIDLRLPDINGIDIIKRIDTKNIKIVIITAYATVETAVKAMKLGAADYIKKPFDINDITNIAERFFRKATFPRKNINQEKPACSLIYKSNNMSGIIEIIEKIKDNEIPVLIIGESGTGKELIARTIHNQGFRQNKPFMGINCAAIPSELLESELFGFEKGAFSGATYSKPGKFELAKDGIIFLDEIGDMSMALQAKLLRVLEERSFERIGGTQPIALKARIIASTNQNLKQKIKQREFRYDLYYRLNGVKIELPPLRKRKDDIEVLTAFFKDLYKGIYNKPDMEISSEAIRLLKSYLWPGNVRELKNVIESAIILSGTKTVLFPEDFSISKDQDFTGNEIANIEKKAIMEALTENAFNRSLAAKALKISRRTLYNKMKKYSLA